MAAAKDNASAEDKTPEAQKRRGHGEDSIYFDKAKGCYVGAVSLGYAPDGSRRRPKVYGRTKTEVRDKLKALKKNLETGVKPDVRYTVANAVQDWLDKGLKGRSRNTVTKNRHLAETHIVPLIGKRRLHELEADEVDDWLETRRVVLATETLKHLLSVLRRSITFAQRRNKVGRNVALLVTPPTGTAGRPSKAMTLTQATDLLRAARDDSLYAYVVLSLLTGVRTEEARALRWDHVVSVSLVKEMPPHFMVWRSVREHGDTKTHRSRRTLELPRLAIAALCQQRVRQDALRLAAGSAWEGVGHVFTTRYGTELDAANVRRSFRRILKRAGLDPTEWTPRELRHSFVSIMSENGVLVEEIARMVGHSSSKVTEIVYRKELRPVITKGAEVMEGLFRAT
jgi:integrase